MRPRTWSTWQGISSVSIDAAAQTPSRRARIFGESGGVPKTSSVPFQWNPMRDHPWRAVDPLVGEPSRQPSLEQPLRDLTPEQSDASLFRRHDLTPLCRPR